MQDCSLFRKDAACPFIHLKNSNLFNYTIIEKKIQYAVNIRSSSIYNKYKTILYYIIFTRHYIYTQIYSCKLSYKIYILNHYRFQSINNFVFDEKKKVVSVSFICKVYFRFQNRSFRIQNRPHRRFWLWH